MLCREETSSHLNCDVIDHLEATVDRNVCYFQRLWLSMGYVDVDKHIA